MDATEATIRTSLHENIREMVSMAKVIKKMGMPKQSDKQKMIKFANAQASVVNTQVKIAEDLHFLRTLGFSSTQKVTDLRNNLTKKLRKINQGK